MPSKHKPSLSSAQMLSSDASNPSVSERIIRHRWNAPKFSHANGNFSQWTKHLKDALILNGIYSYVFSPAIPCPDAASEPHAHANWSMNDRLAITFIKSVLEEVELRDLLVTNGAATCYEDLKSRARREGPIKQIALLQEALSTYCSHFEPLPVTVGRITDIVKRTFDVGDVTRELFTCIALLNSLNDPSFDGLQNSVSTLLSAGTKEKPCDPVDIRLLMENAQNILNSKASSAQNTALSAKEGIKSRSTDIPSHNHGPEATCCKNCHALRRPCRGHTKLFCIQKGGGMAGKSIVEAQAAQKASRKKVSRDSTSANSHDNLTTAPAKSYVAVTSRKTLVR